MFDKDKHVIHLSNSQLGSGRSSKEQIDALIQHALASKTPGGLVINFHGGLVSEKAARATAEKRLYPLLADRSGAYPIFFVWESGLLETPWNNLDEIVNEDLFQEFVKKTAEWLLKKFGLHVGLRSGGAGALFNEIELREQFDQWFRGQRPEPPLHLPDQEPDGTGQARGSGAIPDETTLATEIEASLDDDFSRAVLAAHQGLIPAATGTTRSAGVAVSVSTKISKEAATRLFDYSTDGTRGGINWFKVAKTVALIVIRCIRRFRNGRDHGGYVTVVEEVLRELYIDKIGKHLWWDRMKQDTADAFKDGDTFGGTVFLRALGAQLRDEPLQPRITLVGHSTGAIYICHLLRAAAIIVPQLKFDVIFQAPAVTFRLFAATLDEHASRIQNFRQFAMNDTLEREDALVKILYPSSLLYFVSGLLEGEVDEPLLGMERYFRDAVTFDDERFANIATCRRFLREREKSFVWSPSTLGAGMNSTGAKHGAFDDEDGPSMESLSHILMNGYA